MELVDLAALNQNENEIKAEMNSTKPIQPMQPSEFIAANQS